ncbi:hypothetical protein G9G39_16415 [Cronobacter sp. EKM101R]|uniref:hypothetical protein n=1 Tax=Cronobacter TaxID=413496 RepID=UPI0013EC2F67|nr:MULTISPECIES: hypothetical protein [Cronobacter]KAF6592440.1 hypothetical protein G9G39_16415 [Cronobacter sp. EKM101R]KAF6595031.1 hypothetical protein G9G38_17705 [Cronobacter sp. EKM102R]MDK1186246.1 hypothetical protein [Cronobacter turicensis]MDK1204616.1 hypothetical protein [Cronobacter turicensis]MDK1215410.1 hypothetical protein [Cronobacter turicensis]
MANNCGRMVTLNMGFPPATSDTRKTENQYAVAGETEKLLFGSRCDISATRLFAIKAPGRGFNGT